VSACLNEVSLRDWRASDEILNLKNDEIHIWRVKQRFGCAEVERFMSLLSEEELERVRRFRCPKDFDRFVISRGVLRSLLSRYLRLHPKKVCFAYSEQGKPELSTGGSCHLRFNLAHSGEITAYAFAQKRRIGVDVEKIRFDFPVDEIAERFFSRVERDALRRLPASQRHRGFFLCWTRKEAYLKATGDGLTLPLSQFDVSLEQGQPAALLATRPDPAEAKRWQLENLDIDPDYAGAFVIECAAALEQSA